jgi:hypothetical protein
MFRPTAAGERQHFFDCPRAALHSMRLQRNTIR